MLSYFTIIILYWQGFLLFLSFNSNIILFDIFVILILCHSILNIVLFGYIDRTDYIKQAILKNHNNLIILIYIFYDLVYHSNADNVVALFHFKKSEYEVFVAGCKSLPMVIVHDPRSERLNRWNSGTDGIVRMRKDIICG